MCVEGNGRKAVWQTLPVVLKSVHSSYTNRNSHFVARYRTPPTPKKSLFPTLLKLVWLHYKVLVERCKQKWCMPFRRHILIGKTSPFFLLSDWNVNLTARAGAAILDHKVARRPWEWKLCIAEQQDRVSRALPY